MGFVLRWIFMRRVMHGDEYNGYRFVLFLPINKQIFHFQKTLFTIQILMTQSHSPVSEIRLLSHFFTFMLLFLHHCRHAQKSSKYLVTCSHL